MAVATVVATRGSAPRRSVEARRLRAGKLAGSVSGGCVESDVVAPGARGAGGGAPRPLTYGITDDLACRSGLPCGGEIDVFVERL